MQRTPEKLKARRAHVKNYINKYKGLAKDAVKELADALFLSETTIWKDFYYKDE